MVVVFDCCLGDRGVMINERRTTCVKRPVASGGNVHFGVPDRNNWGGLYGSLMEQAARAIARQTWGIDLDFSGGLRPARGSCEGI